MEKERQLQQHANPHIQNSTVELLATSTQLSTVAHHIALPQQIPLHATGTTLEHIGGLFPLQNPASMEMWSPHEHMKNELDGKMRKRQFYCNHCGQELDQEVIDNIISDTEKPRKKAKMINIPSTPNNMATTSTTTTPNHGPNDSVSATPSSNNSDFVSEKKKQKNQRAEQKDIITSFARIIMTESDASYIKSPLPKDAVYSLYAKHVKAHPIPYHVFWRYVLGKGDNKKQKPLWGVNVQSSRKGGSRGILGVRFRNIDDPTEKNMFDLHIEILAQHNIFLDSNAIAEDLRLQYEAHRPKSTLQYHTKVEHPQSNMVMGQPSSSDMDTTKTEMVISTEMSPSRFSFVHPGKILKVRMKGTDSFRRVAIPRSTVKELVDKIQQKFSLIDGNVIREIKELPNVVLIDDGDISALPNDAELEITL